MSSNSASLFEEVKNLTKLLVESAIEHDPGLGADDELSAAASHWLFNEHFYFRSRSNGLVRVWKKKKEDYLNDLSLTGRDTASQVRAVFSSRDKAEFKFIDLFAGIGGFRIGLERAGGECVFSSEWDKSAKSTYFRNHLEYPFGDINQFTNVDRVSDVALSALVPDHDILAAGFPCQPFSHAGVSARNSVGKEHGFRCKTQGTLFFDVMRIAEAKTPKVLFLENVKSIVGHDGGKTFKVIRESIEDLGYDFKYKIINSAPLVPQRRLRCFMVCFRQDLEIGFKFPLIEGDPLPLKSILEKDVPEKFTISDKLWAGHINRSKRNVERGTGFTAYTADLNKPSNTIVARYGKDGKECLIPQEGKNPRLLTPRECARLQGFPEEFIVAEAKTPAYKQFGNSVAVPVVEAISKEIWEALSGETK